MYAKVIEGFVPFQYLVPVERRHLVHLFIKNTTVSLSITNEWVHHVSITPPVAIKCSRRAKLKVVRQFHVYTCILREVVVDIFRNVKFGLPNQVHTSSILSSLRIIVNFLTMGVTQNLTIFIMLVNRIDRRNHTAPHKQVTKVVFLIASRILCSSLSKLRRGTNA